MKLRHILSALIVVLFTCCKKKSELPVVSTGIVTAITGGDALLGVITTGENITEKGVCWSLQPEPTLTNFKTTEGPGAQKFESKMTGLSQKTTYYVRPYATNGTGTAYGYELSFTTNLIVPAAVTDIDGNVYPSVTINGRQWMASNLKTTRYRDGAAIPNISDNLQWDLFAVGAYCYYDNNASNLSGYGAFYNWQAVKDTRNIAPTGWHVATALEWQQLIDDLGGQFSAGDKIRSTGYWSSSATTNETGFSALPAGFRDNGNYAGQSNVSRFWTQTAASSSQANFYIVSSSGLSVSTTNYNQGMSVRCVKD